MRFDDRAAVYDRHAHPQAEVIRRFVACLPDAGTSPDALELGAGTGRLTRELLAKGYRVRATDVAPGMIEAGRLRVPGAQWGELDAWSPPPACCDRLFSANVLQWCPDPVATLARHRAALRPGGRLAHAIFIDPTLAELREVTGGLIPLRRRTAADWLDAARAAGLRVTLSREVVLRRAYPDALALLRELHGTGAVSGKHVLGPGRLRAVLREYDRRFPAPGGGILATWAALLLQAEPV